ncbi:MAG: GntR family transcriptional regulator [Desulfobacula sp.]|uniref:GntR family transcriptional regulator n=1 Tax=Desulfobacula sp. TaxID=2593537 RepID=UPI0025C66370|nr:GntR family transcriptional regulator [Desulfobacula sp.]MCD4721947.1 GntR family transcriptional regulator [Desulfobacula sp.]
MKDTVYKTIRKRILYLEYQPGQILNEKILAEEFGVSRSPIKDILNRLEWEQFIRVIPRTGSMITEVEFSRIMNIYQVRFEIESFEASLAESQFSSKHCNQLKDLLHACNNLFDKKDPKALTKIDISLRDIIHDSAGNPVLADVSDKLYAQTFRLWYSVLSKGGWQEEVTSVKTEVKKIIEWSSSGKPNGLVKIRKTQLLNHFDRLSRKFLGT